MFIQFSEGFISKKNILAVIENLEGLKKLKPASEEQIQKAEKKLGLKFAPEFKQYTEKYGAISAKRIELFGVCENPRLDVVRQTLKERELDESLPTNMYVVSFDNDLILQDSSGKIYRFVSGKKEKIHNSLREYILESQR